MAFVKICRCGNRVTFERRMSFPDTCPECGLRLMDIPTLRDDDPSLLRAAGPAEPVSTAEVPEVPEEAPYLFRMENGTTFPVPAGESVVGRLGVGGEELADCPSVSRQHIRVRTARTGVIITDLSSYGTSLNGEKRPKNEPFRALPGDTVTLCDTPLTLLENKKGDKP